jgi:hypothetical protein
MTDQKTPYGIIHYNGVCKDDYPNLQLYDQPPEGGSPVKLQAAAMRSFKAAERRYGERTGRKWRAIPLTGSWRSCAFQAECYRRDPNRYASPNGTLHTRGLAIDVSTAAPNQTLMRAALKAEGWHQARPDEPWHYSYFISG